MLSTGSTVELTFYLGETDSKEISKKDQKTLMNNAVQKITIGRCNRGCWVVKEVFSKR